MVFYHHASDAEVDDEGFGYCHVCAEWRRLTCEHVPPQSAFNDCPRLWHRMSTHAGVSQIRLPVRCGFWIKSLCLPCNTSSPHAEEYTRFAKALAEKPRIFSPSTGKRAIYIEQDTHLLAKQIAVMILASEPLSFGKRHEDLRRFVLHDRSAVVPEFRIFGFLVPDVPEAGTVVRGHSRIDGSGEGFDLLAGEISSFPFGFVYGWQIGRGYRPNDLTDITHWFSAHSQAGRRGSVEAFATKVTWVDSLQAIYDGPRRTPQVDYVR
jgi:hypothetical protein